MTEQSRPGGGGSDEDYDPRDEESEYRDVRPGKADT